MQSEQINELAGALSKAQGQFDHAKKDSANPFFKSSYADLASVIDAAKKPLSDNGLAVTQIVDYTESDMFLQTTLMHSSGQWISGRYPIRPIKSDPQSVGSAITYARRYAFSALTGIAADDDDGHEASQGKPEQKQAPKNTTVQKTIDDYLAQLRKSQSLDELQKNWLAIPKNCHAALAVAKDEIKATLQKAAA